MRGLLIAFEGGDRVGKTTQINIIYNALQKEGKKSVIIKFPDRSKPIGHLINDMIVNKTIKPEILQLLFTANRWELLDQINKYLDDQYIVLLDRYLASGIVYGHYLHNLPLDWCIELERNLPLPDLIILFNRKTLLHRSEDEYNIYDTELVQKHVQTGFLEFSKQFYPERWECINSEQSIEDVTENIIMCLEKKYSFKLRVV